MRTSTGWSVTSVGEQRQPLRHAPDEQVAQRVDPDAADGGDRHHLVPCAELAGSGELRRDLVVTDTVDLVDGAHARLRVRCGHLSLVYVGVTSTHARRRVDHVHDDVDPIDGVAHQVVQTRAERRPRLVEPGRVGEHDLHAVGGPDRTDVTPGGLRLVRDDRDLLPNQGVHERGLAHVGSPNHGDDSGAVAAT